MNKIPSQESREVPIVVNKCRSLDSNVTKHDYCTLQPPKADEDNACQNKNIIYRRKIPNQNIVTRLIKRETHFVKSSVSSQYAVKWLHQNVVPNFTVVDIEKPPCFLRKFSPDGKHFIAFSLDQTSIQIYEYKGAAAGETLLSKASGAQTSTSDPEYHNIRSKIFEKFFCLKHTVNVAINDEQLNRECSLFTDDGNYIIVGSAAYINDDNMPPFFEIYRNNESVSPNPRSYLENYTLHLIDMKNGILCDRRTFKTDKIFLSHNQGLYLYHDFLCVLSLQHQTIHVFQVTDSGSFVNVRNIGRFCYEDDEFYLSSVKYPEWETCKTPFRPYRETQINALKHRILVFLYRRAVADCQKNSSVKPLCDFYQNFDYFSHLRMWKMQLIDKSHLLIKYASEDVITLRLPDPNAQPSFFVVYNMVTTEVLAVYENTSDKLLTIFEEFCDYFRNAALHTPSQLSCSPSNNVYSKTLQLRFVQTIINARFGGHTEAVKRILSQLPISSQSYSVSPYLDLALFSYDDKWVSVMERPKACGDQPIRFYARDSGLLRFKIFAGLHGKNHPVSARRLVAFTFHPYDPFAISVQRTNADYVVNFHVRHVHSD
ncbi:DET1 homolog [Trichonephila inaurata madagascariensis]|uniref:DET1 homolog n=1 Tax=Trichonephila inaurata madagascariensis TaxID=2747483 RepID=A0A8X6WMX4_9ARAC|nr:DET1 homolog [Trichonephila inaurata madagascariensis]